MNPAALALSNTDALRSHPMLLGETLLFQSAVLDTHPLGCLHSELLIGRDDILFW